MSQIQYDTVDLFTTTPFVNGFKKVTSYTYGETSYGNYHKYTTPKPQYTILSGDTFKSLKMYTSIMCSMYKVGGYGFWFHQTKTSVRLTNELF